MGARDRLRSFFEANVGKIIKTHRLSKIGGISEYARRIRELRDEEGMQIKTHNDRHDLKQGEYILETLVRLPVVERGISPQLRNEILERNGFTCQLCGAGAGDLDPFNPNRKVRLHVDHIIPKSQGGTDEKDNLRILCSTCNQGKGPLQTPSESVINLLTRIKRAPRAVQFEVYQFMKKKFE